jgi:hypothetical protein
MPNRVYTDLDELRKKVNDLIDRGKVRVSLHARKSHPELSEEEQIGIVRYGSAIQFDHNRPSSDGVYICWARLPNRGLCRAVFCVEETEGGDLVLIITAFQE